MDLFDPTKLEKIIITPEMLLRAQARDPGRAFNSKSFMEGKGTLIGNLGDEMIKSYRRDFLHQSTYDYDFVHNHNNTRITIDNKTKYQSPLNIDTSKVGLWMASVCIDSVHQNTDYYTFCRVCKREQDDGSFIYPYGWVLGIISKKEFFEKAKHYNKGDKEGYNDYAVKQECFSLPYSQLYQLKRFS
jgi:hypothetical protein